MLCRPEELGDWLTRGVTLGELEYVGEILREYVDEALHVEEIVALTETVDESFREGKADADTDEEPVAVQEEFGAPRPIMGHADKHGHLIAYMLLSGQ